MLANKNPVAEYDQYYYGRREQYATVALLCTIRTYTIIIYRIKFRRCAAAEENSRVRRSTPNRR